MKKIALLLAALLLLASACFAACSGGGEQSEAPESSESESSEPEETAEGSSEPEETGEEPSEPEESSEPEETGEESSEPEETTEPDGENRVYGIYDPNAVKYIDSVEDPEEVASIPISYLQYPENGDYYGRLKCSRLGMNVAVYFGDSYGILNAGAGQSVHTFPPGFGRLILLSGHNISYFNPLQYAEPGDIFVFDVNYETYEYRVVSAGIENAEALQPKVNKMLLEEKETLVLYTCYPFNAYHTVPDRYVVYCERVKGLDVKWR